MCKTNINLKDFDACNCLLLACQHNPNIDILKYLVEDCKMHLNIKDINVNNCLLIACFDNSNVDVIKYLFGIFSLSQKKSGYN